MSTRAVEACEALILAYERGEANGGSVEWDELDEAVRIAREAVPVARQQRLREDARQVSLFA